MEFVNFILKHKKMNQNDIINEAENYILSGYQENIENFIDHLSDCQ